MQLRYQGTLGSPGTVQSHQRSKYKPHRSSPCTSCAAQHNKDLEICTSGHKDEAWAHQQHGWLSRAWAGAVSFSLLLQGVAAAEEMSIAFPASADPDIRRAQQTMVESWAYVQALYYDPSFSHTDWSKALQDSLADSFKARNAAEVTDITNQLLAKLGDPYTRLLVGDKAEALAAQEEGKIVATGMGLQQVLLMPQDTAAAAPAPLAAAALEVTSTGTVAETATTGTGITAAAGSGAGREGSAADGIATAAGGSVAAAAAAAAGQEALVVSFVVEGSPAAAAGVAEGDVLLSVSGQPVAGQKLRQVYNLLSKESDVTLLRQPAAISAGSSSLSNHSSSSSPMMQGVLPTTQLTAAAVVDSSSSSSNPGSSSSSSSPVLAAAVAAGYSPADTYTVHLKPAPLEFEPVQFGTIDTSKAVAAAAAAGGTTTSSNSSSPLQDVAYLKVLNFSATAPQEVAQALVDMQYEAAPEHGGKGLAGIIVDLRDNPGGIVEAGVNIAQDFLSEGQMLCIAVDRSGQEERVVLPTSHTLTTLPVVVLVNKSTASTSELLAGALHDELAAPLIGTTTYGKGRSQRVLQLADGTSTLLVSTLKYFTPKHTEIDQVGLKPEMICDPLEVVGQRWTGGMVGDGEESYSLLDDPCIKLAAEKLAGKAL